MTEAGELWACRDGARGRLGLNDALDMVLSVLTRVDHSRRRCVDHTAAEIARGALSQRLVQLQVRRELNWNSCILV